MRDWAIWAAIGLCVFSLWAMARHDWLRLIRPCRRVTARVTGYRSNRDDGAYTYAAIFTFTDESREHQVIDSVFSRNKQPDLETLHQLSYPAGRPDLARLSRPAMWTLVYIFLLGLGLFLFALWMGWVQDNN